MDECKEMELIPCPWCENVDVKVKKHMIFYGVECGCKDCTRPFTIWYPTRKEAIDHWNTQDDMQVHKELQRRVKNG